MSRSSFLRNLRTAAGFLAPTVQSDGSGDARKLARILQSAVIWLTPSAVEEYNEDDFSDWPPEKKRKLSESVREFLTVANAVPSERPATREQVDRALPAFRTILDLLQDYLDRDALQAHQLLDDQTWPDEVVGLSCQAGHDSTGDPCLRVTIVLRDDVPASADFPNITSGLRRRVADVLEKNGIKPWPYVRFTSSAEADLLYATTT